MPLTAPALCFILSPLRLDMSLSLSLCRCIQRVQPREATREGQLAPHEHETASRNSSSVMSESLYLSLPRALSRTVLLATRS